MIDDSMIDRAVEFLETVTDVFFSYEYDLEDGWELSVCVPDENLLAPVFDWVSQPHTYRELDDGPTVASLRGSGDAWELVRVAALLQNTNVENGVGLYVSDALVAQLVDIAESLKATEDGMRREVVYVFGVTKYTSRYGYGISTGLGPRYTQPDAAVNARLEDLVPGVYVADSRQKWNLCELQPLDEVVSRVGR